MEDQADKYIGLNGQPIVEWDGYWTDAVSYGYTPSDNMAIVKSSRTVKLSLINILD